MYVHETLYTLAHQVYDLNLSFRLLQAFSPSTSFEIWAPFTVPPSPGVVWREGDGDDVVGAEPEAEVLVEQPHRPVEVEVAVREEAVARDRDRRPAGHRRYESAYKGVTYGICNTKIPHRTWHISWIAFHPCWYVVITP